LSGTITLKRNERRLAREVRSRGQGAAGKVDMKMLKWIISIASCSICILIVLDAILRHRIKKLKAENEKQKPGSGGGEGERR